MKLPNWAKVIWWAAITVALGLFVWKRLPKIIDGQASAVDIVVFAVWAALLLAPLFSEISLLGVTVKNEIDELKDAISTQISDFKAEVRTYMTVSANISPQINFPPPPPAPVPDADLPQFEIRVKQAVEELMASRGIKHASASQEIDVDPDTAFLFAVRYRIDEQLMRLGRQGDETPDSGRPRLSPHGILRALERDRQISPQLSAAIRETRLICNYGVHGDPVTPSQVGFVRDTAPGLVETLRSIKAAPWNFEPLLSSQELLDAAQMRLRNVW